MAATRNFSTVHYLQPMTKVHSVSLLHRINLFRFSGVKAAILWIFAFLFVYLLASDLYLREIRTFHVFYAGELWLTLWRLMAQVLQAVVHYYSALFLNFSFSTQILFRVIGG